MANYNLARGASWPVLAFASKPGPSGPVPTSLTGFHIVVTVRLYLIDGTVDTGSQGLVWQGDTALLGGVSIITPQSGSTLGQYTWTMPPANTQSLPNPIGQKPQLLFYDSVANDGSGNVFQLESGDIQLFWRVGLAQP